MKTRISQRDRVLFVTLTDILLQFVFVLLIVIFFVYKEYTQLILKTATATVSRIEIEKLKEENNKLKVEYDSCKSQKKVCELAYADYVRKHLEACIVFSKTSAAQSVIFKASTTNEVIFQQFTDHYFKYLKSNNDIIRENSAKTIMPGTTIQLSDIEKYFSFVREKNCYHEFSVIPISTINSVEAGQVYYKIAAVFKKIID